MTLRYLQTLTEIAAEQNSTIIFPLPIELMQDAAGLKSRRGPTPAQLGSEIGRRTPSTSRTLCARSEGVNGFDRKCSPDATP